MCAWRVTADTTDRRRGRHAHAAEEGLEWDFDAGRKLADHPLAIHADDGRSSPRRAIFADEPAAAVVAVGNRQIDRQHLDLERVARLRAFNIHRPCENVPARS